MLEQPIGEQPHYGEHLGDPNYWGRYVVEIARRHALPVEDVEAPFVGTFPTFLIGNHVVKLFGSRFDGAESFSAEKAMHELLASRPEIPAPAVIVHGVLFEDPYPDWHWPYLVTRRLHSQPVRERPLDGTAGSSIAGQLGEAIAALHALPPPTEVDDRDVIARLRSDAPARLARFGLPPHLVEQVPEFLRDAPTPATLVHADITADHLFHDGQVLTGIIDWGDAIVADPYYELVAIAFDCFGANLHLLETFLRSYGWTIDADFAKNAMQGVCEFQFNAISRVASIVDLDTVLTLEDLADRLFGPLGA